MNIYNLNVNMMVQVKVTMINTEQELEVLVSNGALLLL